MRVVKARVLPVPAPASKQRAVIGGDGGVLLIIQPVKQRFDASRLSGRAGAFRYAATLRLRRRVGRQRPNRTGRFPSISPNLIRSL